MSSKRKRCFTFLIFAYSLQIQTQSNFPVPSAVIWVIVLILRWHTETVLICVLAVASVPHITF